MLVNMLQCAEWSQNRELADPKCPWGKTEKPRSRERSFGLMVAKTWLCEANKNRIQQSMLGVCNVAKVLTV